MYLLPNLHISIRGVCHRSNQDWHYLRISSKARPWKLRIEQEIAKLKRLIAELRLDQLMLKDMVWKLLSPEQRRTPVDHATEQGISERRACQSVWDRFVASAFLPATLSSKANRHAKCLL
jgi:hypothetical protein